MNRKNIKELKAWQDTIWTEKCPYCNDKFKPDRGIDAHIRSKHRVIFAPIGVTNRVLANK